MARLPLRAHDPEYLGNYELIARLGSGGMGTVFLGRTPRGRPVAIKAVRADFKNDPELLGRFRSEVTRARQVPPFCTAEVLDADLDHDPPFLVVEYVDGPNLSDVVDDRGPLAPGPLHSAALGIATALAAIHGAGVIHRDLKPDNVLFALGGVKVIDFGIARPIEATSHHTRTDQMVGTISYMAPERFDEEPSPRVGPPSDIFAWGAVVTYAGTGRTPFTAESMPATAVRILTQPPTLTGLPEPLRSVVALALAKDPRDRPTARELVDLLLSKDEQPAATQVRPASAPPTPMPVPTPPKMPPMEMPPLPPRGRVLRRVSVVTAALAVLLVAGVLVHNLRSGGDSAQAVAAPVASASSGPGPAISAGPAPAQLSRQPTIDAAPVTPKPSTRTVTATATATTPVKATTGGAPNTSGRNLALNSTAVASSIERGYLAAQYAVDGDLTTRWGSGFSDPQWLRVDLGASWQISEVTLDWENAHATAYRVELSTDGTTWKSVYSTSTSQGGDITIKVAKLSARFVRMYGTARSTDYGYSLLELEVR